MQTIPLIQQNVSLKHFNTFGIDVNARYFAEVKTTQDLLAVLQDDSIGSLSKLILGGGSNILFTKSYDGLVIKNTIKGIQEISSDDSHVFLKVGAGENWHTFVMHCIAKGYCGIENLSLIPGTIGAAPIQNIGAYGVELCDVFVELEAMRLSDRSLHTFAHADCQFGYRDSIFKHSHRDQYVILSVTLRLNKTPTFHIGYGNIEETLQQMQVTQLSIKAISDAVIKIRRSKLPDPAELGNAGSFFKNPVIPFSDFQTLQKKFSNIPHFSTDNKDFIKVPAGWLIEQMGWKGKRFGEIGVYDKQALILVNYGGGVGANIYALAEKIQASVYEQFGIQLVPEVNLI